MKRNFSRRDFLKMAGAGMGAFALSKYSRAFALPQALPAPQFPNAERLGRILAKVDVRSAPDENASIVKNLYEDYVVEWGRETTGPMSGRYNQRWVETPEGFIYAADVQPVRNIPNTPITAIPEGKAGFWAEVTVPYVDLALEGPPASPWAKDLLSFGQTPRLYYSQVAWIDQIRTGDGGRVFYRFNENGGRPPGMTGGSYGDIFWADGSAFHVLTPEDIAPIHPDVDPAVKQIYVNLTYQTLSCFEGNTEVYFCRISGGAKYDASGAIVDNWSTPLGDQTTWRKSISIHMSGGATGAGYDTPAISWSMLFNGDGVAIHAAFWHNDFGSPRSHGCVNAAPEDARWIFRWAAPTNTLDQGDIVMQWPDGGTHVIVDELRV